MAQKIKEFRKRNFQELPECSIGMFRAHIPALPIAMTTVPREWPMEEGWHGAIFAQRKRASHVTHAPHAHVSPFPRGSLDSSFFAHPSHPSLSYPFLAYSSSPFPVAVWTRERNVVGVTIARTTRTQSDAPVDREGCERRARGLARRGRSEPLFL